MRVLIISLCLLLLLLGGCEAAAKAESGQKKGADYSQAVQNVAEEIQKAQEKADAVANEHMKNVEKDPGSLITKEAMQSMVKGNSFLPQKAGSKSIAVESSQGFNGFTNYRPSSWKITETMSGPTEKKEETEEKEEPTVTYPMGLGPVLFNQCTAPNYTKTSPCYNSKLFDLQNTMCLNLMDSAAFIGVGFDGRGYYKSESRRASLVQRVCANKATFMGKDVPDTMNVFGIFETKAETRSFQSVDQYMKYIRHKAGVSNQKGLFTSEASKYSKASSWGMNLGGIGAIAGGIIGAVAGGPAGAAVGAAAGGAIGGTIGGGSGSGSGNSKQTDKSKSSSEYDQSDKSNTQQTSTQNFFAMMFVNIILYEITLDEVKPTDLSSLVLKDYMSLPSSYYSVGADVKFQNFLLRYGTHFIRSGKFGGQLKVTKTCKTSKSMSAQQFARVSETEFKSMFATLQSQYSQKSSSFGLLGFSKKKKSTKQSSSAKAENNYKSQSNAEQSQTQNAKQSEFTQTSVEAQGGNPEIAEALMDFYTPAFKQLFHDWIVSINDYPKPFEFQLKSMHDLFIMSMKELFPAGNKDFGCGGGKPVKVESKTNKRFYIDTRVIVSGKKTVEEKVRVYCKFSNMEDFEKDMERRRMSLEKAISVYMVEGPFPTASFELPAGETGCEEATLAMFSSFGNFKSVMKFSELKSSPFILAFDMPLPIEGIATPQAKFKMGMKGPLWFAIDPNQAMIHMYDGCQVAESKGAKICFRNIILTYDESTGFFHVDPKDFAAAKLRIPSLPNWLSGSRVARPKRLETADDVRGRVQSNAVSVPCNVKWLNSHRLDPAKTENCIHFTAATEGDIFVVFSSIPKNHHTWYYLQISPEGAAFYQGMKLRKRDVDEGMGVLGNKNLYQSFFVCVSQKKGSVIMQYGKADPDSEVGTVYSGYQFPARSKFSRLSFYSFGSGEKSVSLVDIRLTKQMPKVECLSSDYVKKDGHCVLKCHPECDGCSQAKDNKACQQCKHVRVEHGSGVDKIVECLAECPAGKQPSSTKKGLCEPCPANLFKAAAGNQKCRKCAEGTFSTGGATKCGKCAAGSFKDKNGNKCLQCPAGSYVSTKGARKCSPCPAGKFSGPGQQECSLCPYGHYGNRSGLKKCTACKEGTFADKRGMTSCKRCPVGTSSPRGSRSCGNSCRKGQFSPRKGVPCRSCPPGSFSESAGSSSCSRCPAGHYQDRSGQWVCKLAPKGSYVSGTGARGPSKCPAGTFNSKTGQSSSSVCKSCPAGSVSSAAGSATCSPCQPGTYQARARQTRCQKASPGYYADTKGLRGQKKCRPGTYMSRHGSTGCSRCSTNTYSNRHGATGCTRCSTDTYTTSTGSTSCRKCPLGSRNQQCKITSRRVVATLYPSVRTGWGKWGSWQYCLTGYFVNRFQLRVEQSRGRGDDTSLNSVKMYCSRYTGHWDGRYITSTTGYWGSWKPVQACSGFFNAIQLRSESKQGGGDDTAANDVKMGCSTGGWRYGGGQGWGSWGTVKSCPSGSAICAIRTQIEGKQGNKDDTALNSVQVKCCK